MDKIKIFVILFFTLFLYWILMKKHKYKHHLEFQVNNLQPHSLWVLFADFENIQKINPTIISYQILSESESESESDQSSTHIGSTKLIREYTVIYTEHLVYFSFIFHETKAKYRLFIDNQLIITSSSYIIGSNHETQVFGTTLHTNEIMVFSSTPPSTTNSEYGTLILSTVEYDCYFFLSYYCQYEFLSQREIIHKNIQLIGKG